MKYASYDAPVKSIEYVFNDRVEILLRFIRTRGGKESESLVRDKPVLNVAYRRLQISKRGRTNFVVEKPMKLTVFDAGIYINTNRSHCEETIRDDS